jgi:hypothetical protein
MSAIFFMEFKGFTAIATDLARGTTDVGITPERIRASGIIVVEELLRQASHSASPEKSEHLGGDTWALVFNSLGDAITFGCSILRGFRAVASGKAVFFLKPSIAIGVGDPKWKNGRPLDNVSITTYRVADKGRPYELVLVGDAIPMSLQYQWVKHVGDTEVSGVDIPLKRLDWQASIPPGLIETPDIVLTIPPLLLDSEMIFSPTRRDALGILASQEGSAQKALAFGGPVAYDIPEYAEYLRGAVVRLRTRSDFSLSTLTYIPESEAKYGYAWLELARRMRIECRSRFAPAAFFLPSTQLRPLSYHVYDDEIVHFILRSFTPQRGVEAMSSSFLIRNASVAERFRAEFIQNWQRVGPLDDSSFSRLVEGLPSLSAADKSEAMAAVEAILAE